jgi:uncharacterized membrane protein YjdF/CheY-like chemotaxis protein/anti-sigma regulatory factor (Ser/Thr protein kinase)
VRLHGHPIFAAIDPALTDILEISRIEAGKMNVHASEFHFSDLRDSVRDLFAIPAKAKGIELSFDIDEAIPSYVVGDEGRLRQILFNLVGNATKFTPRGSVRVEARRVDEGQAMLVEFSVTDTGVGIPKEHQEDIFNAFTQVDGSAVRQHGGVGLGLAIVRRLVDVLEGVITVSSEPGQGTTMTVKVPLLPGRSVCLASEELPLPEVKDKRILVVEDDPVNQLALTRMLKKLGHFSTLARNGQEALDLLGLEDFDCVLMDIQMPVMDGLEATRRIRAASVDRVSPEIPIIALTGHAMPGDREHFLEQGMTAYLSKPVDMDCLARLIAQHAVDQERVKIFRQERCHMNWIRSISHKNYFYFLTFLFGIEFILLAIDPHDRKDWALENVLVLVFFIFLFLSVKKMPFSRISYTLIFIFLAIHEIGSHYTYSEVPYDAWFSAAFGTTFNELVGWERNNFDRIVHFLYGLLLAYPIREVYFRVAQADGFWGYFLPLDLAMSTSMLYELIEWGAAEFFGGDLGIAYLGTQGDVWDAHKDMLLASIGALIAMLITLGMNMRLQKDFAREWSRSLTVKHPEPMGEDEIARMLEEKNRSAGMEP